MLVVAPDAELGTLPDVLLLGYRRRRGIVDSDVEHVHAAFVLAVVPSDIGQRPVGLQRRP